MNKNVENNAQAQEKQTLITTETREIISKINDALNELCKGARIAPPYMNNTSVPTATDEEEEEEEVCDLNIIIRLDDSAVRRLIVKCHEELLGLAAYAYDDILLNIDEHTIFIDTINIANNEKYDKLETYDSIKHLMMIVLDYIKNRMEEPSECECCSKCASKCTAECHGCNHNCLTKTPEMETCCKSEDNYIKVDGDKASFTGGAIRNTKHGKGRFDLIPEEAINYILSSVDDFFNTDDIAKSSVADILYAAYPYSARTINEYVDIIVNLVMMEYCESTSDNNDAFSVEVTKEMFYAGFNKMLCDLAKHYEYGAELYGVDNWKKGIPETKGDRGGSFVDSGLRHLHQHLAGETDENHLISCIWNFVCAISTVITTNKRNK